MKRSLTLMIEEMTGAFCAEASALGGASAYDAAAGASIGMAGATKETGGVLRVERSPPHWVRRR